LYISFIFFSPLEQFDVIGYFICSCQAPCFFNVLVPFVLLFIIYLFIYSIISEDLKLVPGSFQRIFEMVVEFIFDLIKQQ
jgi:F0F1-type ATP synthase membrane subunit a